MGKIRQWTLTPHYQGDANPQECCSDKNKFMAMWFGELKEGSLVQQVIQGEEVAYANANADAEGEH